MRTKEIYNKLTIIEKIYIRENAFFYLKFNQFMQLKESNKMILAPYYKDLMIMQNREVAISENFKKSHYGKNRYEYENNI